MRGTARIHGGGTYATAAIDTTRQHSATLGAAMGDVLRRLRAAQVPCEQCGIRHACVIQGAHGRGRSTLVCRTCAQRYQDASPLERRQIRNDIARTRR